jgi:hypothetical protein
MISFIPLDKLAAGRILLGIVHKVCSEAKEGVVLSVSNDVASGSTVRVP